MNRFDAGDLVDLIVKWLDSQLCKNLYWAVMIIAVLYFASVGARALAR